MSTFLSANATRLIRHLRTQLLAASMLPMMKTVVDSAETAREWILKELGERNRDV